jgi:hypothetical protein
LLIGGPITVAGGTTMDSRQPVEGDPWALVTQLALTRSILWWQTVLSVVNPVLAEEGDDAFCYVVGGKSVRELRSDGSLTQRRLKAALGGESTDVKFDVPWEQHPLPDGFVPHGQVGYKVDTSGKRWVFSGIDQPPYTVAEVIGAKVIVDTGMWPYLNRTESDTLSGFEAARAFSDVLLVLPHTPVIASYLDGYVAWVAGGRRGSGGEFQSQQTTDPERWRELRNSAVVPLSAEFKITGVIQRGAWVDPSSFEAARSLLESHHDRTLGFWETASNAALRPNGSVPIPPAPAEAIDLPSEAGTRAQKMAEMATAEVEARTESKNAIAERLAPYGWKQGQGITYTLIEWNGQVEDHVLLYMTLSITKRRCSVSVSTLFPDYFDLIKSHLLAHGNQFEEIAAPDDCDVRDGSTTIWRCAGGWADPIDWEERIAVIVAKTLGWVESFAELETPFREAQEHREAGQITKFKAWGLEPERWHQ